MRPSIFSRTTEYALRAAVRMATHPDESWTTRRISEAALVPAGYLAKILRSLTVAGIIDSQRGPGGGFRLRRPPADLTLLDVVNAVDPIERLHSCPLGLEWHGDKLCPLHARIDAVAEGVEKAFAETSLADVATAEGNPFCAAAPPAAPDSRTKKPHSHEPGHPDSKPTKGKP